jgi:hypothetical protein
MRQTLSAHARVSWFDDFFGVRPRANFQLVLGMLNGGSCYGTRAVVGGSEELYCMLGVWQCDSQGLPEFPQSVMPTVIHEFAHSYANPLIDAHLEKLEPAGNELFARHQKSMERRAYKGGPTVLRESLVRACVVRYFHSVDGADAAKAEADEQVRRGFPWTSELSNVLADYEANRATYPTLDAFMPQIARFFDTYVQTTRR